MFRKCWPFKPKIRDDMSKYKRKLESYFNSINTSAWIPHLESEMSQFTRFFSGKIQYFGKCAGIKHLTDIISAITISKTPSVALMNHANQLNCLWQFMISTYIWPSLNLSLHNPLSNCLFWTWCIVLILVWPTIVNDNVLFLFPHLTSPSCICILHIEKYSC